MPMIAFSSYIDYVTKHMEPMLEIVLYNSFQEAKEQLDFIDIEW